METLTLIEHESIPVVQNRKPGDKSLDENHAKALEKLEKHLPAKSFTWKHNSIKFAHYCGIVSLGSLTIEILPKIYGKETDHGSSRYALVNMLRKARKLKLKRGGTASIALQRHSLIDVFILDFCDQLRSELMQGMIRHYIERKENLNVLRGRLRIEKQFKYNLAHKERLFCQYDELSTDTAHNHVLKYVLNLLSKVATSTAARKQLRDLVMQFDEISDKIVDIAMLDKLVFDRSTSRYKSIFEQCRWFIQGLHPDVLAGDNTCMTLLFDMNRLFEAYVASMFRKQAWLQGFRMQEQGPQKHLAQRTDTEKHVFLMKPDMSFLDKNNQVVMIADAKWKILDDRENKLGVSQNDLYQLISYAARYGVDRLALVYPLQKRLTKSFELTLHNMPSNIIIVPIDVTDIKGSPNCIYI